MGITNTEAAKVLTAAEQEAARREAEILEAQQMSETQSSWYTFMQSHCGQHGLLSNGTGKPDLGNLVSDVQANRDLLMNWAKANCVEGVTPGTLERAFAHYKDTGKLAPLPRTVDPTHKEGVYKTDRGMFAPQESKTSYEYRTQQQPTPPFSKHQLLTWGGQVKGQPSNMKMFREAVRVWGSPAINQILRSEG